MDRMKETKKEEVLVTANEVGEWLDQDQVVVEMLLANLTLATENMKREGSIVTRIGTRVRGLCRSDLGIMLTSGICGVG